MSESLYYSRLAAKKRRIRKLRRAWATFKDMAYLTFGLLTLALLFSGTFVMLAMIAVMMGY